MRISLFLLVVFSLVACSAFHPNSGETNATVELKHLKGDLRSKAEACQASELDLLPQSVAAITQNTTPRLIRIFQSIYEDPNIPQHMQAESLYQIGLIHMNEFNTGRNDELARRTFLRLKHEFPNSALCHRADQHLATLAQRQSH